MDPTLIRFMILLAVFAAVLLGTEVLVRTIGSSRHRVQAMNKRMQLIAQGFSREQVMGRLRRVKASGRDLPGPLGALARSLEGGLTGAGMTMAASTLLLYFLLATVAIFVLTCMIAVSRGFSLDFSKIFLLATFALAIGFGLPMMVFSRIGRRQTVPPVRAPTPFATDYAQLRDVVKAH